MCKIPSLPLQAWAVYLHGRHIDTVSFAISQTAEDVRRGLINHDGFDPQITVIRKGS